MVHGRPSLMLGAGSRPTPLHHQIEGRPPVWLLRRRPVTPSTESNPPGVTQHFSIDHIDRRTRRVSEYLVENIDELRLVFLAGDIAEVRRADHVRHVEQ